MLKKEKKSYMLFKKENKKENSLDRKETNGLN